MYTHKVKKVKSEGLGTFRQLNFVGLRTPLEQGLKNRRVANQDFLRRQTALLDVPPSIYRRTSLSVCFLSQPLTYDYTIYKTDANKTSSA